MLASVFLVAQSTFLPLVEPLEADEAFDLAVHPGGSCMVVTHTRTPLATLVPLIPGGPSGNAMVGASPLVDIDPSGNRAVVVNSDDSTVSVLELPSMKMPLPRTSNSDR